MAKKKKKNPLSVKRPVAELPDRRDLSVADEQAIEVRKLHEILDLLWLPKGLGGDETQVRVARALALYENLAPAEGAEGMLAAQMVGTHFAALECLRRAAVPGQSFAGRDLNLKHAQKLMTLYTQQLAALNKHRGKGQQKVTVEHVNVEAGGQAIVGTVDAAAVRKNDRAAPPLIEQSAMQTLAEAREMAAVKRQPGKKG